MRNGIFKNLVLIHIHLYDSNGNLVQDGTHCYQYNAANRLENVTNCAGTTIARYWYDYTGRKIKAVENGTTIYYPFSGYEARVNGSRLENTTYYYANGELVARNDSGGMHYYHGDQLGSTSLITNSSGGVEEKTKYYPFGQLRSGGTKTKYLYTGQEYLSSVGFYDYGFRQRKTDPPMFMQPDPVTADVYDPQGLNKYSYVRNNPVRYNDPSGEIFFVPFLLMAGVGVLYECNYLSTNSNPSLEGTLTSGFVGSTTAAAGIAGGAVAASAGGAAAASAGLAGTGTELAVAAGSSVVGGQTARGVGNILTGNDVGAGLGNVNDMTEDAIFGAASYGVVKGISSAKGLSASSSQEPLTLKPSPQSAPKETYQTSLHLYDQMAERQISLGDVKSALGGNKFSFVYKTGELQTGYYDSSTKVFVPQNSEGILKTVYKCSQESIDKKIWGKQ